MSECKQCGMCCRAIALSVTFEEIENTPMVKWYKEQIANGKSQEWCLDEIFPGQKDEILAYLYFEPLTTEEALAINPLLKGWVPKYFKELTGMNFYRCKQFDEPNNKCKVHDGLKPRVCTGYPYYGREPFDFSRYSNECGYIDGNSVKRKYENVTVSINVSVPIPVDNIKFSEVVS